MKALEPKLPRRLVLASMLVYPFGCSKDAPPPAIPPKIDVLLLQVRTLESVNQGRSVRMLVRRVKPKQFATEKYAALVAFAEHPDDSVLADQLLRPRSSVNLRLPLEPGSDVGVYFMFLHPEGESWKVLLPGDSGEVTIEVQRDLAYLL